jgi:hypothetical protein
MTSLFVDRSRSHPAAEGKSVAQLAKERGVHAADVICDLAVADGLDTQFLWNSESPAWIEANGESQRNPHMIIGTGDGGAHADRDDGAEWSTYFLRSWLLDREFFTLEEGVRRITHHPAMVCGIPLRGLLARGYHADVVLFDPARLRLGKKYLVADLPGGEERWQVRPEGIVRLVNQPSSRTEAVGAARARARIGNREGGGLSRRRRRVALEQVECEIRAGEVRVASAAGLCRSDQSVAMAPSVPRSSCSATKSRRVEPWAGVTSKEGVLLSTLAHCGRCPACERRPTLCRTRPTRRTAAVHDRGEPPRSPIRPRRPDGGPRAERHPIDRACRSTARADRLWRRHRRGRGVESRPVEAGPR